MSYIGTLNAGGVCSMNGVWYDVISCFCSVVSCYRSLYTSAHLFFVDLLPTLLEFLFSRLSQLQTLHLASSLQLKSDALLSVLLSIWLQQSR